MATLTPAPFATAIDYAVAAEAELARLQAELARLRGGSVDG